MTALFRIKPLQSDSLSYSKTNSIDIDRKSYHQASQKVVLVHGTISLPHPDTCYKKQDIQDINVSALDPRSEAQKFIRL